MWWNDIKEIKSVMHGIRDWMTSISWRMTDLQMKYDVVLQEQEAIDSKLLKSIEKVEDCLKNVDKLNSMINEFDGCVSSARSAIPDKKEMDDMRTILKNMIETFQKYYIYQKNLNDLYLKIDDVKQIICEKDKKKSVKPLKKIKKKPVSPAH